MCSSIFTLLATVAPAAHAAGGAASLRLDVPARQWKAARLANLPRDTVVSVKIESDGQVLAALLDSTSGGRPDTTRPLFAGLVERRLSFSVTVVEAGDHYLVLDNRKGSEPRTVMAVLHAAGKPADQADQLDAANKMMRIFELQLSRIFVFEPFPVEIKSCGALKTFIDPDGIVLCTEYMHQLYGILEDHEKTLDILSFSLFHEISRVLLSKWGNPFAGDVEAVDELTVVLMVMLNQKGRAEGAADYMVKNPAVSHTLRKLFPDDHHPLSTGRAKDVLIWAATRISPSGGSLSWSLTCRPGC